MKALENTSFENAVLAASDSDALYQLGLRYATGEGAPEDLVAAHKWFNLAAAQGDARAKAERASLADIMSAAEIAQAQRLAREWAQV